MLVLGLILTGAWQALKDQGADLLPIKYVRIEGVFQYISKDEIQQALLQQVMTGFFNLDVFAIKRSMLALPWVARVKVQRVWPDTIKIKVYEHYPLVRWGDVGLLNEHGELFRPEKLLNFGNLPLLNAPAGSEKEFMSIMKGLQVDLAAHALVLSEFKVNKREAWSVVLSNGLVLLLGRKQPLEKFLRFLRTLPLLGTQKIGSMQIVDLRYPNGYAVTWK